MIDRKRAAHRTGYHVRLYIINQAISTVGLLLLWKANKKVPVALTAGSCINAEAITINNNDERIPEQ